MDGRGQGADEQGAGELAVGLAQRQALEDLELARRKAELLGAGGRGRRCVLRGIGLGGG